MSESLNSAPALASPARKFAPSSSRGHAWVRFIRNVVLLGVDRTLTGITRWGCYLLICGMICAITWVWLIFWLEGVPFLLDTQGYWTACLKTFVVTYGVVLLFYHYFATIFVGPGTVKQVIGEYTRAKRASSWGQNEVSDREEERGLHPAPVQGLPPSILAKLEYDPELADDKLELNESDANVETLVKLPYRFCTKCNLPKPMRTHHCSVCGTCCLKMDHHCPWFGTCIGFRNYKHFFMFVLLVNVLAIWVTFELLPLIIRAYAELPAATSHLISVRHIPFPYVSNAAAIPHQTAIADVRHGDAGMSAIGTSDSILTRVTGGFIFSLRLLLGANLKAPEGDLVTASPWITHVGVDPLTSLSSKSCALGAGILASAGWLATTLFMAWNVYLLAQNLSTIELYLRQRGPPKSTYLTGRELDEIRSTPKALRLSCAKQHPYDLGVVRNLSSVFFNVDTMRGASDVRVLIRGLMAFLRLLIPISTPPPGDGLTFPLSKSATKALQIVSLRPRSSLSLATQTTVRESLQFASARGSTATHHSSDQEPRIRLEFDASFDADTETDDADLVSYSHNREYASATATTAMARATARHNRELLNTLIGCSSDEDTSDEETKTDASEVMRTASDQIDL